MSTVQLRNSAELSVNKADIAGDDVAAAAVPRTAAKTESPHGSNFWFIIVALSITTLLTALENTVITTSLPVIVQELQLGDNYIWITNGFFLASAVVQPLFGQLADSFGRRWLAMCIVLTFMVGSSICSGAFNGSTLIAGRIIQGVGSGGVNMIVDVIISDLVPLRQRGNYIAIILTVYTIGTSIGPFVGGEIVQKTTWRWVFLITVPIGAVAFGIMFLFLRVNSRKHTDTTQKLSNIDWIGNAIIIGATTSVLLALSWGGSLYPWSSWKILVPLLLGFCGLGLLVAFESSRYCSWPVIPISLFRNRTATVVYINTFLNSIMLYWVTFFLPVYFQAVLLSSPSTAGVQMLPIVLTAIPGAIVAVIVLTKFGKYRFLHSFGFALASIGIGLFILLQRNSTTAVWVIAQMVAGLGSGMVLNTLLPAFQAAAPESMQASATASWAFIRSFGFIWGVAIPAAVFNSRMVNLATELPDGSAKNALISGHAYQYGIASYINTIPEAGNLRSQIIDTYDTSLRFVWQMSLVFCLLAFLLVFLEQEIPLRTELETEFGLEVPTQSEDINEIALVETDVKRA